MPNTSRIMNHTIARNSEKYSSQPLTGYEKTESSCTAWIKIRVNFLIISRNDVLLYKRRENLYRVTVEPDKRVKSERFIGSNRLYVTYLILKIKRTQKIWITYREEGVIQK